MFYGDYVPLLLLATAVMFSCALLQISCLCTWLTVYIDAAVCKLFPWQQIEILCKYLLSSCVVGSGSYFPGVTYSSCVAKVMGGITYWCVHQYVK